MKDIYGCGCQWEETGTGVGDVKGYTLVTECVACKDRREQDAIKLKADRDAREVKIKLDADRKAKLDKIADDAIAADKA